MLQGIQGISDEMKWFAGTVRDYMRDHPVLNRLIDGEESNERLIIWATLDAISDFNGTPPFIGRASLSELLQYDQHALLLRMTVCTLLESVGLLQTRNHLNYSAGGTTVGVNDKTPMIMQWLNYYKSTTEQMKLRVKVAMNVSACLGMPGLHSELWAINSSYIGF